MAIPRSGRAARALVLGLLVAGCAAPMRPDLPPAATDPVVRQASLAFDAPAAAWPTDRWWEQFDDPQLTRIVERALAANPDLKTAMARARAMTAIARGESAATTPTADLTASVTRERFSETGLVPPPYGGISLTAGDVSAALAWKLDLFGAERARIAARRADAEAAAAEAAFARAATGATAARLYFELAAALADRDVVTATRAQREAMLRITRGRHAAGLDSTADLRRAEAQVPESELEQAQAEERITLARAALAALIGAGPDETATLVPTPAAPAADWGVPPDLRIELLARRADVAAARARVVSAAHDVDAARRDYLPNLSLTALAGVDSLVPSVLFRGASRQLSAGPALDLPLYDGGRRRAATQAKAATFDIARAGYERAVLGAVQDVTTALAHLKASKESRRATAAALAAERDAYRIAQLRSRKGLGTQLEALLEEGRVLSLERRAAMLEKRELALRVDLYEALGGGLPPVGAES